MKILVYSEPGISEPWRSDGQPHSQGSLVLGPRVPSRRGSWERVE